MVEHTQTIRRQFADELFECDHFVGLALKIFVICNSQDFVENVSIFSKLDIVVISYILRILNI